MAEEEKIENNDITNLENDVVVGNNPLFPSTIGSHRHLGSDSQQIEYTDILGAPAAIDAYTKTEEDAWRSGVTSAEMVHLDGVTADIQTQFTGTVKTTGDQSITGVKTFTSFPVTPSSAPTTNYQVANKKYVDDSSSNNYAMGSSGYVPAATAGTFTITHNLGVIPGHFKMTTYGDGNDDRTWSIGIYDGTNHANAGMYYSDSIYKTDHGTSLLFYTLGSNSFNGQFYGSASSMDATATTIAFTYEGSNACSSIAFVWEAFA